MATYDLNVPTGNIDAVTEVLDQLIKSGYQNVALNHTVARLNKAETTSFLAIAEQARNHFGNHSLFIFNDLI